jgi:protein ImuA
VAAGKNDIIARLEKDILSLQGLKRLPADNRLQFGLGPINDAFPDKCFPVAAVHEFITTDTRNVACTSGFIACLTATLMRDDGVIIWINSGTPIFPPGLKRFGVEPDRVIFIKGLNQKDSLWVMEEALKCEGLAAVVGEIKDIDFTASRRLQLAVEQSRVTGFVIRDCPRFITNNAFVSRWKIRQLPSQPIDDLPGIGYSRWNIELLRIRNGKPGNWQVTWAADHFEFDASPVHVLTVTEKRKLG